MYQTNSFGCVVKSCCNGGGNVNQIEVIFPNPLNVNINIPTDFNINVNFSASGGVDLNLPPITVNVNVEEITGQIQQLVSGEIKNILDGNVGVDLTGDINSNISGDIGVTGDISVGIDGCIGIKECDKEDCVTLIDDELIRIEIVEDDELKVTNKQNIKINLLVTLLGTKANDNEDFVIMNINLNSNETTTKNIDDSIKDICIVRYVINTIK